MEFYVLHAVLGSRHDVEIVVLDGFCGDPPRCSACKRPVGSRTWLPPHQANLVVHGEALGDVAFGPGCDPVFSGRLVLRGQAHHLRGLAEATAVHIRRIQAVGVVRATADYLAVPIRTGPVRIDEARSRIRRERPIECSMCLHGGLIELVEGFAIAEATWDGTDVFHVLGLPGVTVVSARFREVVVGGGLEGFNFQPTQDYIWDPYATRRPSA
jgi:hypothetical protein